MTKPTEMLVVTETDQNGEIVLDDGSYVDKNGNTVLPDGTVITPDGVQGYYDENGVFHEGESPYEGGYYDENDQYYTVKFVDTITTNSILDELKELDLSKVTPIEAINLLYKYQEEIKK